MHFSRKKDRELIQELAATTGYASRESLRERAELDQKVRNFGEFSPSIPTWAILIVLLWFISR